MKMQSVPKILYIEWTQSEYTNAEILAAQVIISIFYNYIKPSSTRISHPYF